MGQQLNISDIKQKCQKKCNLINRIIILVLNTKTFFN